MSASELRASIMAKYLQNGGAWPKGSNGEQTLKRAARAMAEEIDQALTVLVLCLDSYEDAGDGCPPEAREMLARLGRLSDALKGKE